MNKTLTSKSGNVILELRQESASAWLTIKKTGKLIDEKEILDLIEEAGIKYGFDEALKMIREEGIEKDFDIPFPIAVCHRETTETEAQLNYYFDPDAISDGGKNIALSELAEISYVHDRDVIAGYSDNIFERDGSIYDIFGELITKPVVDEDRARAMAGEYVRYEAHDYIAETMGYPYLDSDGKISILTKLNVDAKSVPKDKFIRSPLALEITGDLQSANLACARELVIHGNIKDSSIFCESDVIVTGRIENCVNPGIQVLGNLRVGSIYHSRVYAKKRLDFDTEILHSTIATDGDINGLEVGSRIVGGLTQAAGNIRIAIAGDASLEETEIEIAISPFYRAILMQMTKEAVRLREEGDSKALEDLQNRIHRCEEELDKQLNDFLKRAPDDKKTVSVSEQVYPKTLFRVLKHSYQIKNRQKGIYLEEKE
nr:uncharacterized protein [Candidatus Cloacimonadota bacterium]